MQQQMKIIGSECYYLSGIAARLIGPAHLCQNPSVTLIISTTPAPEASPQKILLHEELENYNSKKVVSTSKKLTYSEHHFESFIENILSYINY